MTWWAAHAVFAVRLLSGEQCQFSVEESIILIEADDAEGALRLAIGIGRGKEDELAKSKLRYSGEPARTSFEGVRKVIKCDVEDGSGLGSGVELTYNFYVVDDESRLKLFAKGGGVELILEE